MGKQHIQITQNFDAPIETIFNYLTDHEIFGQVISTKIKRVKDSHGENKNGVGSVRRISIFPTPDFEETVITYEPNQIMEYVISKGSPIKNHKGCLEFSQDKGQTRLVYNIYFEPRLPFALLGGILKKIIEKPIRQGIKKLAHEHQSNKIPQQEK